MNRDSVNAREKEHFCIGSKSEPGQCKRSLSYDQLSTWDFHPLICAELESQRSIEKISSSGTPRVI